MKIKCKICKKSYKSLTNEFLCSSCHLEKYGTWSKDFQDMGGKNVR